MSRPLVWTVLVALALLVPLPAGLLPAAGELGGGVPPDLVVHVALFAALSRSWLAGERAPRPGSSPVVVLAVTAYGGLLELVQPWVGRSGEWSDVAADLAGALAGWVWARSAARRRAF